MFYVYILELANKQYYTGYTEDILTRVKDHNFGKCETTRKYRPVKLVWFCCFNDKNSALKFEKYLKSGSGIAFRNRHIINK
ncbi:hypothetical protein A3F08_00640 [Candidatus Berkelbacteria bacterium RIFCSPHIGHO2_12_FULL_36_9]|uniref:GIY-YIG domain-containing protein n=1 Tax=Candidatus Berkelbacteria bacterium RIFCSPHIGHO2_12_FULL_36_9 TaxID=1797469 RepID=A0A1F5EJ70_9BACT|nr:MAG: hypothetical protein A3F08_00640 [Candidatus Berkelbacteria bacterium RIFCSPHIGHO2_12_FULL_36_9]